MATFNIPNDQGQIRQGNRGDVFGELWETFNIDLSSSPGKLKTSKKLKGMDFFADQDFDNPTHINDILIWSEPTIGDDRYFIITEDSAFSCLLADDPTDTSNWSEVAVLRNQFDWESTAVIFDGQMRVSLDTDILRYNGSGSVDDNWWTDPTEANGTALTSGFPHVLHVHKGGQETLFVTDKNNIRYYNTTAEHSTVEIQNDLVSCAVDSGVSAIWVGTYSITGGNAYVYEIYVGEQIDGTPVARNAYKVDGQAVLALWVHDNIPHIITERGNLQAFNGAGFTTIAEFPFVYSGQPLSGAEIGDISPLDYGRPITPRGVKTYNDSTFILINTDSAASGDNSQFPVTNRSHSGIWEYNHRTQSLNHRFAPALTSTDYGANNLDRAGALLILDNQYTFLMAGMEVRSETAPDIFFASNDTPQGWFVTPEFTSGTIQEAYERVYHKAKTLAPNETIHTLYRVTKRDTLYADDAVWLNSSTFNTLQDWSNASVGDLVRVSSGYASGEWAVIKEIETSASTTSITLYREIGSAGEESKVYSDNFKLFGFDESTGTYDEQNTYKPEDGEYKQLGSEQVNGWIQYMVICKGNIEYRQFTSKSNAKNKR